MLLFVVVELPSCIQLIWDPTDCSPPGFFFHGISQARLSKGLLFPSAGNLPDPWIELTSPELVKMGSLPLSYLGSPPKE